jgi:hypothetical protein
MRNFFSKNGSVYHPRVHFWPREFTKLVLVIREALVKRREAGTHRVRHSYYN